MQQEDIQFNPTPEAGQADPYDSNNKKLETPDQMITTPFRVAQKSHTPSKQILQITPGDRKTSQSKKGNDIDIYDQHPVDVEDAQFY